MQVVIVNSQKDLPLSRKKDRIKKMVQWILREKKVFCDEVIFHFVSKSHIAQLHRQFFQDPSVTDCITFPLDTSGESGYKVLGEAFICPAAAIEYVREHKLQSPYEELTLYIVHCILHLLGYDDIEKKEKQKMQREEKRILTALQHHGLIL